MTPEQKAEQIFQEWFCRLEIGEEYAPLVEQVTAAIQSAIDETWEEAARVADASVFKTYAEIASALRARKGQQ